MGEPDCRFEANPQTRNLHDALTNLCQLLQRPLAKMAASCSNTPLSISKWNHSNLDDGRKLGRAAAQQAIAAYDEHIAAYKEHKDKRHFINENPEKDERWRRLRNQYLKRTAVQRQGKGTL
jgi:hypothetical protein